MKYIKVKWIHNFLSEPTLLLSEIDSNRNELRKIEIFADGSMGYASEFESSEHTLLGEMPIPVLNEISSDPQFVAEEIGREEFESYWSKKTFQGKK
jgi:hypothetical protein